MISFDQYAVELTLQRDMLGTNPCDPNVMDTHIIDKQRKMIMAQSKVNKEINKYLEQLPISQEKGEAEVEAIFSKLEELTGVSLTDDQKKLVLRDGLEALKETFAEADLKGTTVFFWNKELQRPMIGDHMIYGFLKASAEAIGSTMEKKNGTVLRSVSWTQGKINQHIRISAQFITFDKDLKREENGKPVYSQRSLRANTAQGPRVSLAKSEVVEAGAKLRFILKVLRDSPITEDVLHTLFSYGEFSGLGQWRNAGNGMFSYELNKLEAGAGGVRKSPTQRSAEITV